MECDAGRPVAGDGQVKRRGEGVAIVLTGSAIASREAGECLWKVWNSTLVTATLVNGHGNSNHIHILSCYAPTFAASREEKDEFFNTLQQALSGIPSRESFVMLGDLNACLGSRTMEDEWWNIRAHMGMVS